VITVSNDITVKIECSPEALASLTVDIKSSPASAFFMGEDMITMALYSALSGTTELPIRDSFEATTNAAICSGVTFDVTKEPQPEDFNIVTSCPGSDCSDFDDLTRCFIPNHVNIYKCCGGEWSVTETPYEKCPISYSFFSTCSG
jgi:hypothetical protein